jgi:hypothetical protein
MAEEKIEVIAYAGYRAEESPRAILLDGNRIEVRKILSRWTEEDAATRQRKRCFRFKGSDFRTHTLCYDEDAAEWRYFRR